MMKQLLIAIGVIFTLNIQAQVKITGVVKDSTSKEVLGNVFISVVGLNETTTSDIDGKYKLDFFISKPAQVKLNVRMTGYLPKQVLVDVSPGKNKTLDLFLVADPLLLGTAVVQGNYAPTKVWGSEELNVADFAFTPQGIMLLTYEEEERWKRQEESKITLFNGARLLMIDSTGKELMRFQVGEIVKGFYTDYLGEVFLQTRHHLYYINQSDLSTVPMDQAAFDSLIAPIVDTIGTKVVYSNYNADYPAFEYHVYDQVDSTHKMLRYVVDEQVMELFRSSYKYLDPRSKLEAFRYEIDTGIDKEVIAAYMSGFQNSNYYEPLNAPLVVSNGYILIFDHHHDEMLRMDLDGMPLDSSVIQYHKTKKPDKWSGKILVDKGNSKVYTYNTRNGYTYVYSIDVTTGESQLALKLFYRYTEKLRIDHGKIYYTYRPYESSQNRYLYHERLIGVSNN